MPSDADRKKYFDIREAPRRLRRLVEERERSTLGEETYRTLDQRGQMKETIDGEVKRMQKSLRKFVEKLQTKGYSDQEAHERAWQSLLRNWPSTLDDGEPEKKEPSADKEPSPGDRVCFTGKSGMRYMLYCPEPMDEQFKRLARALQGDPGEPTDEIPPELGDLPGREPNTRQFGRELSEQELKKELRQDIKERLKKKQEEKQAALAAREQTKPKEQ